VGNLLREIALSLDTATSKCRAQEYARRQRAEIIGMVPEVQAAHEAITKLSYPQNEKCLGCGSAPHPGGHLQCPAHSLTCHFFKRTGHLAKVCKRRKNFTPTPLQTMAVHTEILQNNYLPMANESKSLSATVFEPATKMQVGVSSLKGQIVALVLLNSGADVSIAGESSLNLLNDHPNNLLP